MPHTPLLRRTPDIETLAPSAAWITPPRLWALCGLVCFGVGLGCARPSPPNPTREPARAPRAVVVDTRAPNPSGQALGADAPASEAASLPADARVPGRFQHTMTPLGPQRAVVVGGYTRGEDVRGALSGSLRTDDGDAWAIGAGAGGGGRWGHTATHVRGDTLVLLGGSQDNPELSPFLHAPPGRWDAASGAWTPLDDPQRHAHRIHHTATRLDDGAILVAGGLRSYEVPLDTAALLDPASGRWTALPAMPGGARFGHTATRLTDGRVLIAGGRISSGCGEGCPIDCLEDEDCPLGQACADGFFCTRPRDTAALFEPKTRTWQALPPLPHARFGHTATRTADGRVVVTGGFTAQGPTAHVAIFTPKTLAWSTGPALPSPRWDHAAALSDTAGLILTGGRMMCLIGERDAAGELCSADAPQHALSEVLGLAPDLSGWRVLPSMIQPRYQHTLIHHPKTAQERERLVVWGGADKAKRSVPGGERWELGAKGWRLIQTP